MTGDDLKRIRHELGETVGRDLTSADMAKLIGLTGKTARETYVKWEKGDGPSGPAASFLGVLCYASLSYPLPDGVLEVGSSMLSPQVLDSGEKLVSEAPTQIAESVFREMMLAIVRARLN